MSFIFSNLLIQRRTQSCRSNVIQFSMQALGSIFHASTKNGTCPVAIHANSCWLGVIFAGTFLIEYCYRLTALFTGIFAAALELFAALDFAAALYTGLYVALYFCCCVGVICYRHFSSL